jgi:peptidoglycan/LPS O-acetylase OafA/YrhL
MIENKRYHKLFWGLMILSVAFNIVIVFINPFFGMYSYRFTSRIPIFLLGCYEAVWIYNGKKTNRFMPLCYVAVYLCFKVMAVVLGGVCTEVQRSAIARASYVFGTLAIVWVLPIFFEKFKCNVVRKVFGWFGKISLEIYLAHVAVLLIFWSYVIDASVIIYFIIIIPISILWAVILNKLRLAVSSKKY